MSLRVEIPFFVLVGKKRESRTLIIAGIHGDEYEGVAVLQDLARKINPENLEGTLTLLPVANPQAFFAGTRPWQILPHFSSCCGNQHSAPKGNQKKLDTKLSKSLVFLMLLRLFLYA
ncbi:MAG: succinylglutamate desuccinylase/aspartoacylase family protein [Acidobacteria bacterium]|nr:succinylglutamate desuccinylase/aspartoacylase family protein [Acidobacteriota bacterium]MCI0724377.1 succinylglutamate desuccinylase/aspartoacylase family protein [Acidobacteriota bacterium]